MSQRANYYKVSPDGMSALGTVYRYIRESGLSARLIELVFMRTSQINGCAYCIEAHSRQLIAGGLPIEHLVLIPVWREAGDIFNEEERAALAWAENVTRLGELGVGDEAFEAARSVFAEKQLVDLTLAIAMMNAYNRMAIGFRATPKAVAR